MSNLTWTLGGVKVTRVVESVAPVPVQGLFPDASVDDLARHESWLKPHFMDAEGNLLLSIHGLVVESCGKRILVDTCMGDRPIPEYPDLAMGDLFLRGLEAAGFERQSIDVVLCTHLHFDHVGSNTMLDPEAAPDSEPRWVPTFPNARYLFARLEYEHWETASEREFVATHEDAVLPIVEAGLADLVETDHRVTDEVWLEATPGHTPGHVAVRIASGGAEAMITGDLTHHPVQWAELDWRMGADSDSPQAAETRRRLLKAHAGTDLLVIGTHYAEPCSGHLVEDGQGGHRFDAAPR
ncbi:MAG: MBL fold metallo-hydrolase [Myxococcota bacterium]|nr:MBL fold metallo-hydrolase [Myxococcota bacterium]